MGTRLTTACPAGHTYTGPVDDKSGLRETFRTAHEKHTPVAETTEEDA